MNELVMITWTTEQKSKSAWSMYDPIELTCYSVSNVDLPPEWSKKCLHNQLTDRATGDTK